MWFDLNNRKRIFEKISNWQRYSRWRHLGFLHFFNLPHMKYDGKYWFSVEQNDFFSSHFHFLRLVMNK
jgi:hypothetical protein